MKDGSEMMVKAFQLLRHGNMFVHFDPRVSSETMHIPPWLRDRDHVVFEVGFGMPIPIPDLTVTEMGISGTLSFKGVPYQCYVPWTAVKGLVGRDGADRLTVWERGGGRARRDAILPPPPGPEEKSNVVDMFEWKMRRRR